MKVSYLLNVTVRSNGLGSCSLRDMGTRKPENALVKYFGDGITHVKSTFIWTSNPALPSSASLTRIQITSPAATVTCVSSKLPVT